ncbi:GAF domain-containing protein [Angustibacter sp. Root456]|uniref:GAF domain-containing protein n=1 Tax=Angustibacter sp. Root456 TaxID=1736539 RepID=UPI00191093F6|nr:GAF domain-containing protein [Angustibacter sp. Root456]
MDRQRLRDALGDAVTDASTPLAAADSLCAACVQLLGVDGASISFIGGGRMQGTFGSSSQLSRTLDELQFTYGEGPCLDAASLRAPVLVPDLDDPLERRWPALTQAVLDHGVHAMFALPIAVASTSIGALDLYRRAKGALDDGELSGGSSPPGWRGCRCWI